MRTLGRCGDVVPQFGISNEDAPPNPKRRERLTGEKPLQGSHGNAAELCCSFRQGVGEPIILHGYQLQPKPDAVVGQYTKKPTSPAVSFSQLWQ